MYILVINYPKCSTCQKAKRFLKQKNIEFEDRNIVDYPPTVEELRIWKEKNDLDLKKFFNTSGKLYKEFNLKEKVNQMSDEEMMLMLSQNGMLVKRPILVYGDQQVILGFNEEQYAKLGQ